MMMNRINLKMILNQMITHKKVIMKTKMIQMIKMLKQKEKSPALKMIQKIQILESLNFSYKDYHLIQMRAALERYLSHLVV